MKCNICTYHYTPFPVDDSMLIGPSTLLVVEETVTEVGHRHVGVGLVGTRMVVVAAIGCCSKYSW
jgi:hypothetical protein